MNYKHSCVIDVTGFYVTLVLVLLAEERDGKTKEKIQHYTLKEGESLLDVPTPSEYVKPRWNGAEWEEAATPEEIEAWESEHQPQPTPAQQISGLKQKLTLTDYQVIKCSECQLAGQPLPYDVAVLHAQRQELRDQINTLESALYRTLAK